MTNSRKFWDKTADKYAVRPVADEASYATTLDIVRGVLPAQAKVLELGCGTGSSALRLAGDVGHLLGTDISARMIEIATKKAADSGVPNVSFAVAGAQEPKGAFDAVLAFNLLHLLDNVPEVLKQAHGSLKSGGVIVSKSACLGEGIKHALRLPIWIARMLGKAPLVAFHSRAQLDAMFVAAGFDIERAEMLPEGSALRVIVARKR